MTAPLPAQGSANVRLDNGIIHIEFPLGARVTQAMVEDIYRQRVALLDQAPAPQRVLAWGTRLVHMDYGASRYTAGKPVADITGKMAIVVQNSLERSLGSMFLHMFRPAYEARLFDNRESGLRWLLGTDTKSSADTD